jgi:hypothetical protein
MNSGKFKPLAEPEEDQAVKAAFKASSASAASQRAVGSSVASVILAVHWTFFQSDEVEVPLGRIDEEGAGLEGLGDFAVVG